MKALFSWPRPHPLGLDTPLRALGQSPDTPGTWMLTLWPGQWLGLWTVDQL